MQIIFLVLLLKVISAQDAAQWAFLTKLSSPQCKQLPVEDPKRCCIFPDLFEIETKAGCSSGKHEEVQTFANRGSPDCAERTCLLRNNDLLFDNDEIDKDAVKQYLNGWVAKRRDYLPAVNAVKDICLGKKPMLGPKEMCEADKLLFCITSNFYNNCPNWLETQACTATRAFLEGCMPYYD
ncbi:general odorant-binding protein 68-like [Cydia pomonella]|uniref:general odorant-binding protein 68-like n=1 Tax=Cydia pomonella TaxID=82600 RepID=UPI002ADE2715|nr:general odorant-binding protein 68-like [Cydia pomonella]